MKISNTASVKLSQFFVLFFGIVLLILDVGCWWIVRQIYILLLPSGLLFSPVIFTAVIYAASIPAWVILFSLWQILRNIRGGEVFVPANVRAMRRTSWCCFAMGLVFLAGIVVFYMFLIAAVAAGFMGLIVRIVKNAFQVATEMKDELDLTV